MPRLSSKLINPGRTVKHFVTHSKDFSRAAPASLAATTKIGTIRTADCRFWRRIEIVFRRFFEGLNQVTGSMEPPFPHAAPLPLIGWREWVSLPQLATPRIKVKVDTGARSSSLHAFDLELFTQNNAQWVRFCIHPLQRSSKATVEVEAPVLDFRCVRCSSGELTERPVIVTTVQALGAEWPIELTLANRDQMGFRMLLGRQAVRGRFLIDPSRSYCGGKLKKKK
jgi:hypothetical protein